MTEDRVPTHILQCTMHDECDLDLRSLVAEQPAPPLNVERLEDAMLAHAAHVTATEGLHSGCTFDCAADILARLGSTPSTEEAHRGD